MFEGMHDIYMLTYYYESQIDFSYKLSYAILFLTFNYIKYGNVVLQNSPPGNGMEEHSIVEGLHENHSGLTHKC